MEILGYLGLGVTFGLISGILISKKIGLTPSAKELTRALQTNEEYYRTVIARLKGKLKEYEQPSELQRLANKNIANSDDLIKVFMNEIGGMRSLPAWVRPFLPAIQKFVSENPEVVNHLLEKFMSNSPKDKSEVGYL